MAGAEVALRDPVAAAYRALLGTNPSLAPEVSRDLIARRRWDFAEQLQDIRQAMAKQDPLGAYALDLYLRAAAGAAQPAPALPSIVGNGQAQRGVE